jgi:hypothetical protein
MNGGGIIGAVSGLGASLGTNGIGVTKAQLGGYEYPGTIFSGQQSGRSTGAAAADDEDIYAIIRDGQINGIRINAAGTFQQIGKLNGVTSPLLTPTWRGRMLAAI